MSNKLLTFQLNKTEKLVFDGKTSLSNITCCNEGFTKFIDKGHHSIVLAYDLIQWNVDLFARHLKKAVTNTLQLHSSITKDIGYLANEERQNNGDFIYRKTTENSYWIGDDYQLWNTLYEYDENFFIVSWLYNNTEGEIIFELTLLYKWTSEADEIKKGQSQSVPYEEWIKTYQPILTRTIPREVAQQWLDQANTVLKKIDENMKRFEAEDSSEV